MQEGDDWLYSFCVDSLLRQTLSDAKPAGSKKTAGGALCQFIDKLYRILSYLLAAVLVVVMVCMVLYHSYTGMYVRA